MFNPMPAQEPVEPWSAVADARASALENQLNRELTAGHVLYGRRVRAVAVAGDDVLFDVDEAGACAVVHLTWSDKPQRSPWPWTLLFESRTTWAASVTAQ